jgi:thiamine pyrophosphate-dependent acetolactate synthase large subunit-like protein
MRAIGFGLSTSIGFKPRLPVAACGVRDRRRLFHARKPGTGDGGGHATSISIIVVRNDAYGNMKRDQIKHHGGRVIGTELHLPDLCALAGAYRIEAERVAQPKALLPAVKRALAARKPVLLDVICPIEGI